MARMVKVRGGTKGGPLDGIDRGDIKLLPFACERQATESKSLPSYILSVCDAYVIGGALLLSTQTKLLHPSPPTRFSLLVK